MRRWLNEYMCACILEHIHEVRSSFHLAPLPLKLDCLFTTMLSSIRTCVVLNLTLYNNVVLHKNLCCAQLDTWSTLALSDLSFSTCKH